MHNGLNLDVFENVFNSPDDIFERLENEIKYLQPEECKVKVKGKVFPISRQIAAFGDSDELSYSFSGLTLASQPWTPFLLEIKNHVENITGYFYNFVLVNRYKDGNSFVGQHKDNEPELEKSHPICSLSFGETRTMVFKRTKFPDQRVELKSNSILLMKYPTNQEWSHGIPTQKKRTGVRINLTFRMMNKKTSDNKRQSEDMPIAGDKKARKDEPKGNVVFKENDVCDGMFPLGDNVFVYVNNFRGNIVVHIRRFEKHGQYYYPTAEGITMDPWCIEHIMGRKEVPKSAKELLPSLCFSVDEILIRSKDFLHFIFTRIKTLSSGEMISKCITISAAQWTEMINQYDDIAVVVLDYVYRDKDFESSYEFLCERPIEGTLPSSLDVSLGTDYLLKMLVNSLCMCIKECGGLSDPTKEEEQTMGNTVKSFNSAAFSVHSSEIADYFYHSIWSEQRFLALLPAMYVTREFLRNVRLDTVLREARKILCPEDA